MIEKHFNNVDLKRVKNYLYNNLLNYILNNKIVVDNKYTIITTLNNNKDVECKLSVNGKVVYSDIIKKHDDITSQYVQKIVSQIEGVKTMDKKEVKYLLNLCNSIQDNAKNIDLINCSELEKIEINEGIKETDIINPSMKYTVEFNSYLTLIKELIKELNRYNLMEFIGIIKGIKYALMMR